jgi:hypothetical protein
MDQSSRPGSFARIGRSYPRPQPSALAPKQRSRLERLSDRVSQLLRRLKSR